MFFYLLAVHLSGMGFFMVFRMVLHFYNYGQTAGIEDKCALLRTPEYFYLSACNLNNFMYICNHIKIYQLVDS